MTGKASSDTRKAHHRAMVLFCTVAAAWWAFDRMTKIACDTVAPSTVLVPNVGGLFDFRLVHNTGAAWGMFGDSTAVLGVFSLIVCVAIVVYIAGFRKWSATMLETFSLALVFAGGLGNAFDRLAWGYVVDFIETTFVRFPVFNVADIGVTCGIVLFLIGVLVEGRTMDTQKDSSCD